MTHLIASKTNSFEPFFTEWLDDEKISDDMIIFDLHLNIYMWNLESGWKPIEYDNL